METAQQLRRRVNSITPLQKRAIAYSSIAAFLIAALAVDWRSALGPTCAFISLLLYVLVSCYFPFEAAWSLIVRTRNRLPTNPAATRALKAFLGLAFFGLHLSMVAAVGENSQESWLAVAGKFLIMLACYAMSTDRAGVRWWPVFAGMTTQFWMALFVLKTDAGSFLLSWLSCQVTTFLNYALEGAQFLFGEPLLVYFAFGVLPVTIFFGAVCAVLLHLGVLQVFFKHGGTLLAALLGVTPAEGIIVFANIFLSMSDTPLLLKPLLPHFSRSQLFSLMTGGFASVAGSVLSAYISMGADPNALLAACFMSAPASVAIAKLMVPDTEELDAGDTGEQPAMVSVEVASTEEGEGGKEPSASEASTQDAAVWHKEASRTTTTNFVRHRLASEVDEEAAELPPVVVSKLGAHVSFFTVNELTPGQEDLLRTPSEKLARLTSAMEAGQGDVEVKAGGTKKKKSNAIDLPDATTANVIDALAEGAIGALPVVGGIAAALIGFVSSIAFLNNAVKYVGSLVGWDITFTKLLGYLFWPVALFMGVPLGDCEIVGQLLGTKTVVNEFVAYSDLGVEVEAGTISERAAFVATYGLCGFSNFGSMGIMVGTLASIYPPLKPLLMRDVFRALLGGTLVCVSTGCMASAFYVSDQKELSSYSC